jgi:hypothetical protein
MKTLLRVEELGLAFLAFYLFMGLGYAWWWFFLLLLAPDLSMIGYLINSRVGAFTYNAVHHKAVPVIFFIVGGYLQLPLLEAAALITLGHSSLDRALGYGLKYGDSFQHTHLGMIGRGAPAGES